MNALRRLTTRKESFVTTLSKLFEFSTLVYSKNPQWKNEIDFLHLKEEFNRSNNVVSFVIISTYSSFVRSNVFESLNSFIMFI